jgi:DHA1 family bicyclomycin/chloramphenicol resistance-like MFS transporter
VTEGPFVFIEQLGVPADAFGFYHAGIVAAFVATSLAINRVADRVPGHMLLRIGTWLALAGGGLGVGLAAAGAVRPWTLCLALAIFIASLALVYAVAPLRALAATRASTGSAASWRGFLEMSGAMLGSAGVLALHDGTPWPLVSVLALAAVCIAAGDFGARRLDRRPAAAVASQA